MKPVDVAAISDTGRVREANEDSFLVDLDLFIFAVADGMGGHVAGEIASATAIESLRAQTAKGVDVATAIYNANIAVRDKSAAHEELSGMGTTLTAIGFSSDHKLCIAHVGDSRAYLYRKTETQNSTAPNIEEFKRITKDHSFVEELVDLGQITEEEANVHPKRSVITRALGISNEVEVDTIDIEFKKGDRYLLCSDGLTSMVRDDDILEIIQNNQSTKDCTQELVRRANQAGGNDNITVVTIDVLNETLPAPISLQVASSISAQDINIKKHSKKGRVGFIFRVFLVLAILAGIGFGAYKTAEHYSTQGFFLDERNGEVVLMSGSNEQMLFWEPQVDTQTGIEVKNLTTADRLRVQRNVRFDSRGKALTLLDQFRARQAVPEPIELFDPDKPIIPTTAPSSGADISGPITVGEGTAVSNE